VRPATASADRERASACGLHGGDLPEAERSLQWRGATIFRHRSGRFLTMDHRGPNPPGFASRSKMVAPRHPSLRCGPCHPTTKPSRGPGCGCKSARPPASDRREGRDGRGHPTARHRPWHAMTLPSPPPIPNRTRHRRPPIWSTNWPSTAIAPVATSRIRDRCPSPKPRKPSSTRWLMRLPQCSPAQGSRTIWPIFSGRSSTCSTARSTASSASSMPTSRNNAQAKSSRTDPRCDRWSLSAWSSKARI
jgi:hypothetical protein